MVYKFAITETSHPVESVVQAQSNSKEHKTIQFFYSYEKAIKCFTASISSLDTGCVQMFDLGENREVGKFYI